MRAAAWQSLLSLVRAVPAGSPVIHTGIDLAAPEGTPFYAAASGWVLADYDRPTADANTRIIIQHDGRNEGMPPTTCIGLSYVEEGDYVHAGDPIGEGNAGFSTDRTSTFPSPISKPANSPIRCAGCLTNPDWRGTSGARHLHS